MGNRVLWSALLFLALLVTPNVSLTTSIKCPRGTQLCQEKKTCEVSCEETAKVNITAVLAVRKLISDKTPAEFNIHDLQLEHPSVQIPRSVKVKIRCPADNTVNVEVTQNGITSSLTSETEISVTDQIKITPVPNRGPESSPLFRCLVTYEPSTTDPVLHFGLVTAILPNLAKTVVIPKTLTLTKDDTLLRVPMFSLLELRRPSLYSDIGALTNRLEPEDMETIEKLSPMPMDELLHNLTDALTKHKEATKDVELLISKPKDLVGFNLTLRDDQPFFGRKIKIGGLMKASVYIEKLYSVPVGLTTLNVTAFSEFVTIAEGSGIDIEVVKNNNFPPVLKRMGLKPQLLSMAPNSDEFQCGDHVSELFEDKNTRDTLSCVLLSTSVSTGVWKYQDDKNEWNNVPSLNPLTSISSISTVEAVVLSRFGKFKFVLSTINNVEGMNINDAIMSNSIFAFATDGSDLQKATTQSPYKLNVTAKMCPDNNKLMCLNGPNTAMSQKAARLFVFPQCSKNCDDQMVCGDEVTTEVCSECGTGFQYNECIDECFDPQSNPEKAREGKDCRGLCDFGDYQLYPDSPVPAMCLPAGLTDEEIQQYVCLEVNKGQLNKCQQCYGGNTGKTETEGIDVCGVCAGNGSCDVDCAGVPKGPKKADVCGQCLAAESKDFNSKQGSPLSIGEISPGNIFPVGTVHFEITGCNLQLLSKTPRCKLENSADNMDVVELSTEFDSPKVFAELDTSQMTPGVYSVWCSEDDFSSNIPGQVELYVHDQPTSTISNIQPGSIDTNQETDIRLCGFTWHSNSAPVKLTCLMSCPFSMDSKKAYRNCMYHDAAPLPVVIMHASQDGNNCVICHSADILKQNDNPGTHQMVVFLKEQPIYSILGFPMASIPVNAAAPQLQEVTLNAFCELVFKFDKPVEMISRSMDGMNLFTPSIPADIRNMSKNLVARLRPPGLFLQASTSVVFMPSTIRQRTEAISLAAANGQFTFTIPAIERPPSMKISSTSTGNLTACQTTQLSMDVKGIGSCMRMSYGWSVNIAGGVDNAFTQKVTGTTSKRLEITADDLIREYVYEVTGTLRYGSYVLEDTFVIMRESLQATMAVRIIAPRRHKPTKGTVIKAEMLGACSLPQQQTDEPLRYVFALKNRRGRTILPSQNIYSDTFIIPSRTLIGGKSYIIHVSVSKGSEETTSQRLLPVPIRRLKMSIDYDDQVNVASSVTITAKLKDRNNSPLLPSFMWKCKEELSSGRLQLCDPDLAKIFDDADTGILEISSGILKAGSCYIAAVNAEVGKQMIKKKARVCCVGYTPPKVRLSVKSDACIDCPFKFAMYLRSNDPVNVEFTCTFEDGLDCDTSNLPHMMIDRPFKGRKRIVIRSRTGIWTPGNYTFDIHVTSLNNPDVGNTNSITIPVLQPPDIGTFQIVPAAGEAMNTTFALIFDGMVGEFESFQLRARTQGSSFKKIGILKKESQSLEFKLPKEGAAEIKVKGCTENGCTEQQMPGTLQISQISESDALDVLENIIDEEDLVKTVFTLARSDKRLQPTTEIKQRLEKAALEIARTISPEVIEDSMEELERLAPVLALVDVDDEMKEAVIDGVRKLLRGQQASETVRRKRSVEETIVQPLSEEAAQTMLSVLVNLYQNVSEDHISQVDGERFVDDMEAIGYRLCANSEFVYPDSDPLFLDTPDVLLKVHELSIHDGFSTVTHDIVCANCSEYNNNTARIRYGASVTDELDSWDCTDEINCTSACFVTAIMKKDFLSAGMNSRDKLDYNSEARVSDVIAVLAANPETYTELNLPPFSNKMDVAIPLLINENDLLPNSILQCNAWVDQAWSAEVCQTNGPYPDPNGVPTIICSCDGFGYFSVMEEQVDVNTTTESSVFSSTSEPSTTSESESSSLPSESSTSASESSSLTSESSTMGSESSSSPSESSTSGSESSSRPSESSTSGSESSSSPSESSTSGSESSSQPSESSTSGSESSSQPSESSSSGSESSSSSSESSTSTPEISTTITTTVRSTSSKEIRFKVSGSLAQATENSTSTELLGSIRTQVAAFLNVSEDRIQSVKVYAARKRRSTGQTGSFIVGFVLLGASTPSEGSTVALEEMLRSAIANGTLTLTDASGNPLTIDPTFFESMPVTAEPEEEEEEKYKLVPIIVGVVVGVFCLILIVVIIIVVLKSKKRNSVDDSPCPSATPTSSTTVNDDKQAKPYIGPYVSASPLPDKHSGKSDGTNQGFDTEKGGGPSTSSSGTNSPSSGTATRSEAQLSREGTSTSHGNMNGRNMTPIG